MIIGSRTNVAVAGAVTMIVIASITKSAEQVSITLADELRTAFYEHAPPRMATAMATAVHSYCKAQAKDSPTDVSSIATQAPWLCAASRHYYWRNVHINGGKGIHGLACDDAGLYKFPYFGVDLAELQLTEHSCVAVDFDGTAFQVIA